MRLVVYKRVYSHWQFGEVTDGDRDLAKGPQAGIESALRTVGYSSYALGYWNGSRLEQVDTKA